MSRKKLEENFEKLKKTLSDALAAMEGYDSFDGEEVDTLPDAMRRLGDTLDMRLRGLGKEVEYVRISKLNVALLSGVLSRWANDLEQSIDGLKETAEAMEKEWKKLDTAGDEFETLSDEVLEMVDEHYPELDIKSELQEADRS